jgi:hypothetical protein
MAPNVFVSNVICSIGTTTSAIPSGSALERSTSIVCGRQRLLTRHTGRCPPAGVAVRTRRIKAIASAAAVASSRSEALATSIPVKSVTIVWKLRSDSRRPCAISD